MTFDLSPEHLAHRDRARTLAARVEALAATIDRDRLVPPGLAASCRDLCESGDLIALVVIIEEIAAASGAVASVVAAPNGSPLHALTGLRGGPAPAPGDRTGLVLAATALGVGRSALRLALDDLKAAPQLAGEVDRPHWVLADAATDLDAARLMTYRAALDPGDATIALARLMATPAAGRAVDAAARVLGAGALTEGATLERLSRDIRALSAILGTEDALRSTVASVVLGPSSSRLGR